MALNGTWTNELGSTMELSDDGQGGLTGTYVTAAGAFQGAPFPLVGRYDTQPGSGEGMAIGWVVVWQYQGANAHSVTTWSGQIDGTTGEIVAMWLLTSETDEQDAWGATQVGQDQFWPMGQERPEMRKTAAAHPMGTATA